MKLNFLPTGTAGGARDRGESYVSPLVDFLAVLAFTVGGAIGGILLLLP
ncbi:hypothetical protein [Halovivax cerinus]|uniref:Uncharacterized protein n=1 Tax=Halovivax cerinus TaxID=1487865 RepID=A0ABD5NIU2_9EURY|nr:hypothetical protein [Halovivax cerinus]